MYIFHRSTVTFSREKSRLVAARNFVSLDVTPRRRVKLSLMTSSTLSKHETRLGFASAGSSQPRCSERDGRHDHRFVVLRFRLVG